VNWIHGVRGEVEAAPERGTTTKITKRKEMVEQRISDNSQLCFVVFAFFVVMPSALLQGAV
jgi:hypothetical protein